MKALIRMGCLTIAALAALMMVAGEGSADPASDAAAQRAAAARAQQAAAAARAQQAAAQQAAFAYRFEDPECL